MRDESARSVAVTKHAVVIAGGGPTGLMLAGELALARVDVAIVERRANQDVDGRRAGGLHSRTIEVLDQRGIADRFLSQGKVMQVAGFAMIPLDISDFPTRHNYGLALGQEGIERTLAAWVDELAVPTYRGLEVTGFAQDETGVDVELSDGRSLRAKVLVGCDGGRSLIRKKAPRGTSQGIVLKAPAFCGALRDGGSRAPIAGRDPENTRGRDDRPADARSRSLKVPAGRERQRASASMRTTPARPRFRFTSQPWTERTTPPPFVT